MNYYIYLLLFISPISLAEVVSKTVGDNGLEIYAENETIELSQKLDFVSISGKGNTIKFNTPTPPRLVTFLGEDNAEANVNVQEGACKPLVFSEKHNKDNSWTISFGTHAASNAKGDCAEHDILSEMDNRPGFNQWREGIAVVKSSGEKNLSLDEKTDFVFFTGRGNIAQIKAASELVRLHIAGGSQNNKFIIDTSLKDSLSVLDNGQQTVIRFFDFESGDPLPF